MSVLQLKLRHSQTFSFQELNFLPSDLSCHDDVTDGEPVEFEMLLDTRGPGSRTAANVTGPDGVRVQGAPRQPPKPKRNDE